MNLRQMSLKRYIGILLVVAVFFIAGVAVGRFVMPRNVVIITVDIKDIVEIIERYNEAQHELEKMKEWNKEVIVEPKPKEEGSEEPEK